MSISMEEILAMHNGMIFPGGCDYCDAYQKIKREEVNLFVLLTMHDDDCPFIIEYEARNAEA